MDPTLQDAANQLSHELETALLPVLSAFAPLTAILLSLAMFTKVLRAVKDAAPHTAPYPPAPTEPLPPTLTPEEEELVQWNLRLQLHDHLQATLHGSPTPTAAPAQVGLLRQALRRRSIQRRLRHLERSLAPDTQDTRNPAP